MKKRILFYGLLLLSFSTLVAQNDKYETKHERIKALKISFLTYQLNLSSKEAALFWPVYNKYSQKLHQLERVDKHNLFSMLKKPGGLETISEPDAKALFNKLIQLDAEIYKTKTAFNAKLTSVLSYSKILVLKAAEKKFLRNLMKKYKNKERRLN